MTAPITPKQEWDHLDSIRGNLLTNCEKYALLTQPQLFPPKGVDPDNQIYTTDYQSVGSQGINTAANKVLTASFPPSKPFFKLRLTKAAQEYYANVLGIKEEDMAKGWAPTELEAAGVIDDLAWRAPLLRAIKLLMATGNALMTRAGERLRILSLRNYAVARNLQGDLRKLVIAEHVVIADLEPDTKTTYLAFMKARDKTATDTLTERSKVTVFTRYCYYDGEWHKDVAVNMVPMPQFDSVLTQDEMDEEASVLTWELPDERNYGVGLIEQVLGDLSAYSLIAESALDGSIQTLEIRWLANPSTATLVTDFKNSRNGDALAGRKDDLIPISAGDPKAVEYALQLAEKYEQRLQRAFLMLTPRSAERVTAEELRRMALEIEVAYGGVYSHLSPQLQRPLAKYALRAIDPRFAKAKNLRTVLVTGLSVLSRNAQAESVLTALQDMAAVAQLPQQVQSRIKVGALADIVGAGRGVDLSKVFMTDAEAAQVQQQQTVQAAAGAGLTAAAENAAQGTQ